MGGGKVVWGCFRGLILGIKYVCDNYVNTYHREFRQKPITRNLQPKKSISATLVKTREFSIAVHKFYVYVEKLCLM